MKIRLKTWHTLILAGISCLVPLIIMSFQYLAGALTFKALVFEAGVSGCFFWSFFITMITRAQFQSSYIKVCLPNVLCVSIPLFSIGIPMFVVLTTQNLEYSHLVKLVKFEAFTILFLITMTFSWLFIQYYFLKPEDYPELEGNSIIKQSPKLYIIPGLAIYSLTMSICLYSTINTITYIENQDFSAGFYLNIIYLLASPLMVIIGTVISKINSKFGIKINLLAIIGLTTSSVFLGLYLNYPEYQNIFGIFLLLPSFFIVFWGYLSTLKKKLYFVWGFSFLCTFIAFPICFLLPFGLFGSFPLIAVYLVLSISLLFTSICLIIYLKNHFQSFCKKEKFERTKILKSMTCYNSSLLLITIVFILSEGTLLYMYLTAEVSSSATGAVLAMLIIICLLYVVSSISLQVKLNKDLFQKLVIVLVIVFSFLALISGILAATLSDLGPEFTTGCISACISCIFLLLISVGLLYFRYRNKKNSKVLMAICNLFMWIFIVLPLGVGLPSALSRATSSKRRNKIIGVVTIFLGLIFMAAVSIISILYSVYEKKNEKEEQTMKCCNIICGKLKSNKIKCEYLTVREFYDRYSFKNFEKKDFKEIIENETYFSLRDSKIKKYKKEFVCIGKQKQNDQVKKSKKNSTFWQLMNCFNKQDYEEMTVKDSKLEEEEPIEKDLNEDELRTKKSIEEVDLDYLYELPCDELTRIKPYKNYEEYSVCFAGIPDIPIPKQQNREFFNMIVRDRNLMKIDKSMRNDWLGAVFDLISSPPDEWISANWLPESSLFSLLRYGGISTVLITDQEIRLIYFNTTMKNRMRPLTKSVFIDELIHELAQIVFPTDEFFKRETKFIVDYLFDNLLIKFDKLFNDIQNKSFERDPYRENLIQRRPVDIRCSDREKIDTYRVLISVNEDSSIKDSTMKTNSISPKIDQTVKKNSNCEGLYNYFISKGKSIEEYIKQKSNVIENKLKEWNKEKQNETEEESPSEDQGDLETFQDVTIYIVEQIDSINKNYSESNKFKKLPKIHLKISSNYLAILTKLIEFFQLCSIGVKKEINWSIIQSHLSQTSDGFLIENIPYFIPIFWTCFGLAFIYALFAYSSKKEIVSSTHGRDSTGSVLRFTSLRGFSKLVIQINGSLLYMFILKSQLSVFACNINEDPPVLWNTNIVCYESFHIAHLFSAILCLFVYYPIATFLYPMYQFNDSKLEIKFETTFVILLSQAKLIITAITVFLPYQQYLKYQLLVASIVIFMLFIYFIVNQPCMAIKVNIWMSAGYFVAFLTNFMGLINIIIGGSIIVDIIYFVLIFIAIALATFAHIKVWMSKPVAQEPEIN